MMKVQINIFNFVVDTAFGDVALRAIFHSYLLRIRHHNLTMEMYGKFHGKDVSHSHCFLFSCRRTAQYVHRRIYIKELFQAH